MCVYLSILYYDEYNMNIKREGRKKRVQVFTKSMWVW